MLKPKWGWFLAFTAVFAVLAGFVFWGTWSLDFAPVMPDCRTSFPATASAYMGEWIRSWMTSGKFVPDDIKVFLGSPWFWVELQYALAGYFAALGMAYYCRGRGLSNLPSYGAGLLLAFCCYWFSLFSAGHLGWFRWMTYGVFAFGLADRAVRKNKLKNWLLLGACIAWASFYQPDLWFLFAIFTALYFIWCCVRERRLPWKGAMLSLVVFAIVGLPSFPDAVANKKGREEMIARGDTVMPGVAKDEKDNRWIFVTNWSLPTDETAEFFIPRLNGDTSCPLTLSLGLQHGTGVKPYTGALGRPLGAKSGNYRQHSLYVGWITCLLALIGGIVGIRSVVKREPVSDSHVQSSDVPFFVGAAVLFWLLSLGRYCEPVYRIVFALPIGDTIRCPVKWHHLTELSLVVLAGYGIQSMMDFFGRVKFPSFHIPYSTYLIPLAVVLIGAFDVARIDRVFCSPVDLRQAHRMNCNAQMSVLRRQDFANPQVAEMVNRGYIVSLANYLGHPDMFLVEVLKPCPPASQLPPLPPVTAKTWLGILSLAGTLAVGAYAAFDACGKFRNGNTRKPNVL